MAILSVKDLSFKYPAETEFALENINFDIDEGEFVVISGESGCGKSTLLRLLKKQFIPSGEKSGKILYMGEEIENLEERRSVTDIGFVMQNPDNQIVTDKVWRELAFGLESLGEDNSSIRRKVAEVSGFFGINEWYHKLTSELSGGQKQLLNLASVMVMQPKILVLDEPTSQLDPIASSEFIGSLKKINTELGMTIILVEHRLEEVFQVASKVILMDKSKILMVDSPRNIGKRLKAIKNHKMNLGMPSSIRIFNDLETDSLCPLNVRECKDFLKQNFKDEIKKIETVKTSYTDRPIALEVKNGYFRYEREAPDVISGLDLKIYKDEIFAILGGNGVGKTTLLKLLSGLKKLYSGKISVFGKDIKDYKGNSLYRNNISLLPQNPQTLFVKSKVYDDLLEVTKVLGYEKLESEEMIDALAKKLEIEKIYERHPYDLSGGEIQKVALLKILLMKPKIILLDEVTKGIDAYSKQVLAEILFKLKAEGITIVLVTHDIEFVAKYSDRSAMFFDGQIVSVAPPVEFFSDNSYYTTSASRISRDMFDNAVTCEMVVELCKKNGKLI